MTAPPASLHPWTPVAAMFRDRHAEAISFKVLRSALICRDADLANIEIRELRDEYGPLSDFDDDDPDDSAPFGERTPGEFADTVDALLDRIAGAIAEGRWLDAEMDLDDFCFPRAVENIHTAYTHAMEHGL